jgi:hypothetical protein
MRALNHPGVNHPCTGPRPVLRVDGTQLLSLRPPNANCYRIFVQVCRGIARQIIFSVACHHFHHHTWLKAILWPLCCVVLFSFFFSRPMKDVLFVPYHGRFPTGRMECLSGWTPYTPFNLVHSEVESSSSSSSGSGSSSSSVRSISRAASKKKDRSQYQALSATFRGTLLIECTSRSLRGSSKQVR